ncbi:MAG: acyl-CoA dehydrogenase family protein [Myxococcaceae bacterium]|nr:acyl-CoA dehydrogenase family protein [Myxococcaceae bacterium]
MSAGLESSVRDFCRREVRALDIDERHSISGSVLDGLRELGLFGATLPPDWGGSGLSALEATKLIATLAQFDRSVATTVGLHLGLGTRGLVAYGDRSQQERWLPRLASGECLAAFATTEPGAGSDLSALETTAREVDGGLVLHGTKLYVTNGGLCSLLTVTARTPGLGGARHGTSLLLVDPQQRGVVRQREERKLGLRGSSTTAFAFDDCRLERAAVLGEPGSGARQLVEVLSWGRLLLSAGCTGTARTALTAALAHVHARKQFRRPLLAQPVVQHQLSRAWALTFGMRALVEAAAVRQAELPALARLTTSAKVFCSEAAGWVTDLALQLHGGSGYIEDTGLAILVRDARVTRIFEGANDVLLTHAGQEALTHSTPDEVLGEVAAVNDAVKARRTSLCADPASPGLRALTKRAELHALGQAVVWRDAAVAATRAARTPEERAAAGLLQSEALRVATAATFPDASVETLTTALREGMVP